MANRRSLRAAAVILLLAILRTPSFVGGSQRVASSLSKARRPYHAPKLRTQCRFFFKSEEKWEPYVKAQIRTLCIDNSPKEIVALEFEPEDWRYVRVLNSVDDYVGMETETTEQWYFRKFKDKKKCSTYYAVSQWSTFPDREGDLNSQTPIEKRDENVSLRLIDYTEGQEQRLAVKSNSVDVVLFGPDAADRLSKDAYRSAFKEAARLLTANGMCLVFGKEDDGDLPDTAAMFFTVKEKRERSYSKYACLRLAKKPLVGQRPARQSRPRVTKSQAAMDEDLVEGFEQSVRSATGVSSEMLEDALLADEKDEK